MQNLSFEREFHPFWTHFRTIDNIFVQWPPFFSVNTVLYVYRDNEPVQDRMRQQLQPLTKHIHVISTKNLSKFGSRFLAMSQIHTLRFVFGPKLIINQRVCHGIDWQNWRQKFLNKLDLFKKDNKTTLFMQKNKILRLHSKIYHPPRGHLHDEAILLLQPESFNVLLSYVN